MACGSTRRRAAGPGEVTRAWPGYAGETAHVAEGFESADVVAGHAGGVGVVVAGADGGYSKDTQIRAGDNDGDEGIELPAAVGVRR